MRKDLPSPLAGAAPALQPTAHPLAIPIGATPPPANSPLMQLAAGFAGFNEELRNGLVDAAARADRDAQALGEIEARRTNAEQRMDEINALIKQEVDAGKVSHVRLPAFEQGFRMRAGRDLAESVLQEQLLKQLPDVTRVEDRVDPEKVINDVYAQVSSRIHPGDLWAREGFDATAQGVLAGFRQRAVEGYTANYQAAAEGSLANDGAELTQRLADASADDIPILHAQLKAYLDGARKQLPKGQVNDWFRDKVVLPTLNNLTGAGKIAEARQLLQEIETFDVTGKGGLFGKIGENSALFAHVQANIDQHALNLEQQRLEVANQKRAEDTRQGADDAATALLKMRQANGGKLPFDSQPTLLDQYRNDPKHTVVGIRAFEDEVRREFDQEGSPAVDAYHEAEFMQSLDSTRPDDLATKESELQVLRAARLISPSIYAQAAERLKGLASLRKYLPEHDETALALSLYNVSDMPNMPKTIAFGGESEADQDLANALWDHLTPDQKDRHELMVTQRFRDLVYAKMRTLGNEQEILVKRPDILKEAKIEARTYARSLLQSMVPKEVLNEARQAPPPTSTKAIKPERIAAAVTQQVKEPGFNPPALLKLAIPPLAIATNLLPTQSARNVAATRAFLKALLDDDAWKLLDVAKDNEIARTAVIQAAVRQSYKNLLAYPLVPGSDPNVVKSGQGYVDKLRAFATKMLQWGGAEYLTSDQMLGIGLNPLKFSNVGTKAGQL